MGGVAEAKSFGASDHVEEELLEADLDGLAGINVDTVRQQGSQKVRDLAFWIGQRHGHSTVDPLGVAG